MSIKKPTQNPILLKRLETERYIFQYHEEGAGLPILFIHGYPGRPQDFRWLFPFLSSYRILALAMPNLDLSVTKKDLLPPTSIEARKNAVLEFLHAKNIKQCLVCAHSMGGPIATALVHHHPNLFKGLILIASVGAKPYRAFRRSNPRLGYKLLSIPFLKGITKPMVRFVFAQLGFPKKISIEAMEYVLHCATDFSFSEHEYNLKAVRSPVLSIWSEDDPLIETKSQENLGSLIFDYTEIRLPSGQHNPQRMHPEQIAHRIELWAQDICTEKEE